MSRTKDFLLIAFIFVFFTISIIFIALWVNSIENPIERGLAGVTLAIIAHSCGGRRNV